MTSPVTPSSPVGEIPDDVMRTAREVQTRFNRHPYHDTPGTMALFVARAILAERERRLPDAIDIFRTLKANRKRSYADIAHLIAASIRGTP